MKKKIAAIFAAVVICASFTGCGKESGEGSSVAEQASSKTAVEKAEALKAEIPFTETGKDPADDSSRSIPADQLKDILGIDSEDVIEFAAYICPSGAIPDEFGIFAAKDADAAKRIESTLTQRKEQRYKEFEGYKPNEMYKFEDSFVETNGNTVIYAVCADNSKARELLR